MTFETLPRFAHLALPLAAAIMVSACTHASLRPEQHRAIDQLFASYDSTGAPGASVTVVKDGAVIFQKGYGLASLEEPRRITPSTNFRLASMTKQFTAMCIMMLKEQGKLSYADTITRFVPGLPAYCSRMTVRHLLTHTSGLPDYESLIPDSQTVQVRDADIPALLHRTDSVPFLPGTKYSYSNTGYSLLSLIVEHCSGERFEDFLRTHIFTPLAMQSTLAYINGVNVVPERAFGYTRTTAGFAFADQSVSSAVLGDGGIYSNMEDLVKWDAALYTDRLVSRASLDEAFADATLSDGTPIDYGYGWHKETFLGIRHPYHDGSTRGFRNSILRFPSNHLTVIVLTNRNEGDPRRIAKAIASMVLEGM